MPDSTALNAVPQWLLLVLPLLVLWDLSWRGMALWRSAQKRQVAWFVCLMIFNTLGILPIAYLLINKKPQDPLAA
ncbi:MAG TPA: DUF5652 family protein [Coriobacteriia bacterium]